MSLPRYNERSQTRLTTLNERFCRTNEFGRVSSGYVAARTNRFAKRRIFRFLQVDAVFFYSAPNGRFAKRAVTRPERL